MEKFKELSNSEMQEINGGIFPGLVGISRAIITGAVLEVITEGWEKCRNDFNEGYNEVRKFRN